MHIRTLDWLSSALGLACLSSLYLQLPGTEALEIDITSPSQLIA